MKSRAVARQVLKRRLGSRTRSAATPSPEGLPEAIPAKDASGVPSPGSTLSALLGKAEQSALAIYEIHGLPIFLGHYAEESNGSWTFLGARLSPSERWDQVHFSTTEGRRRFSALENIGAITPGGTDLAQASELLVACAGLRGFLREGPVTESQLEWLRMGFISGKTWQALSSPHLPPRARPLKLVSPETFALKSLDTSDRPNGKRSAKQTGSLNGRPRKTTTRREAAPEAQTK